jgi:hypothetical protein
LKETTMNTSTLLATIVLTVATSGAAFAQEATYDYPQAAVSQKTRAEVATELRQALAAAPLISGEATYRLPVRAVSNITRAEVNAQALAAIASGEQAEASRSFQNGFDVAKHSAPSATRVAGK